MPNPGSTQRGSIDPELGPISPELALVDPELRAALQQRLLAAAAANEPEAPPAEPVPAPAAAAIPIAPSRRYQRLRSAVGLAVAFAAGAAAATVVNGGLGNPETVRVAVPANVTATSPAANATAAAASKPPATTAAAGRGAPGAPGPVARLVAARTWSWAPVEGATTYRVTFTRAGRVVFSTRTKTAKLVLPQRLRLTKGAYRWTVVPVAGAEPRRATVDSRFVVF